MPFWQRILDASDVTSMGPVLARLSGLAGTAGRADHDDAESGGDAGSPPTGATSLHKARDPRARNPETRVAFTIAIVALGAKMAKADGRVTIEEVDAFKQVFTVAPADIANVGRVFDLARQDMAGYEAYADQLAGLFQDNKALLRDVLEGLFHIATADGVLHPAEDQFLAEVARRFAFTDSEYAYVRSHFVETGDGDPYHVLALTPAATDAQVRAQYRQLVRDNHPDRYVARGLPKETIEIANRKLAAITAAYAAVAGERGLK